MRFIIFILSILMTAASWGQNLKDGIYPIIEQLNVPAGIEKIVEHTKEKVRVDEILLINTFEFEKATPTFDENHQPMLAIKLKEDGLYKLAILQNFNKKNDKADKNYGLLLDNHLLTIGTLNSDSFYSRYLFKGEYTFEETKRLAEKINKKIEFKETKEKNINQEEKKLDELFNKFLFESNNLKDSNFVFNTMLDDFAYRSGKFLVFNKMGYFENIKMSKILNENAVKKEITPIYYYWNKKYDECEIVGYRSYFKDNEEYITQFISIWRKEKNEWKIWRLNID